MKDMLRNLFSIRQQRKPAPVGGLPQVGATIQRGEVKMAIDRPVPRELWDWLVLSGWRSLPVQKDRRKGRLAAEGSLQALIDATSPQERNQVHERILEAAQPEG